ncbi:ScyD/ScyE family protein [Nocardioides sp.]|uniref:ScyD/ScyE family protein n=1 Tax=Nocardioides sp. TaxID=35761 RepID=UPI003D139DA0
MKLSRITVAAAGACTLALAVPTSAPAAPVVSDPIVSGLLAPLQIDLGTHGKIYVGQSFSGVLTRVNRDGSTTDLLAEPAGIDGVASGRRGIAYTSTDFTEGARSSLVKLRKPNGTVKTVADLWPYEEAKNPDARNNYGFLDLTPECAAEVDALPPPPPDQGPPVSGEPYAGTADSHPYALANDGHGGWYVADAGMNTIMHIGKWGRISTVAVLPPQPLEVSAEIAAMLGMPDCTVGSTYAFEAVPTDVEVARGGRLIVSLLPGGPEDPSFGARGSVYEVKTHWRGHHRHGKHSRVKLIAGGFLGATNVALDERGRIYVSELFGGKVSVINRRGHVSTLVELPNPAGVEYKRGKVYVSYDVFPPEAGPPDGKIATVWVGRPRHHH